MKIIILLILIILISLNLIGATCTQRYCGIKGAKCSSNKGCAPGFYCGSNGLCVTGKLEGDRCGSNKECALGNKCINKGQYRVCVPAKLKGLGEKCTTTSDCMGSLSCTKGKCIFTPIVVKKTGLIKECTLLTDDCLPTQYCNNKTSKCIPRLTIGSNCIFKEDVCESGSICGKEDGTSNYLQGKCIPLFSKKIGESCFSPQFGECSMIDKLYCPTTSGSVSTCIQSYDRKKTCKSNSDCDTFWQECECDGKSTNMTCHSKFNIDGTCSRLYTQLQSCLILNSCSVISDINGIHETNPSSCVMKNCQQPAVCFYSRCLRSEFGGCKLPDTLKCSTNITEDFINSNFTLDFRTSATYSDSSNGLDQESVTLTPIKPKSTDGDEDESTATSTDETASDTESNSNSATVNESGDLKPKNTDDSENTENYKESNNSFKSVPISITLVLLLSSLLLSL